MMRREFLESVALRINKSIMTIVVCASLIIAGCVTAYIAGQDSDNGSDRSDVPNIPGNPSENSSSLVAYFSWSGNTKSVAEEIQKQTGSDIFEIVPVNAYTNNYNDLLDIAQEEQYNNMRPAIVDRVENIDEYDVIYLGFPIWYNDVPMIICTFLGQYDLSEKTIVPFCTSGGSGISGAVQTISSMEPYANIKEGLRLGESAASNPESVVSNWLTSLELSS